MGCHIDHTFVGCIAYADDILLLSASVVHLHKMLEICQSQGEKLDVRLILILINCVYLLLVKIRPIRNRWPIYILVLEILHMG